jgi:hypothetical protein
MPEDPVEALILDLLQWMGPVPRRYAKCSTCGARRVPDCRCGRPPRIEASSAASTRREAGSSACPTPGPSTCATTGQRCAIRQRASTQT